MANTRLSTNRQSTTPGASARDYRRAARHSRLVTFLKFFFPTAALLAVVAFAGVTVLARAVPKNIHIAGTTISGGKLIMLNPHMTGEASKSKTYSVTASRAVQDLSTPNIVRLEDIAADIEFGADDKARLDAISGVYDRQKNFLTLDQPFTIVTTSGMTAKFRYADVNIEKGELHSDEHVSIDTEQGKISANKLAMTDNGAKIVFEDDVQMTIAPSAVKQDTRTGRTGDRKPTEN
jgi:lipopolysaccharide export system protein LptC